MARQCATCGGTGKELIDCDGSAGYRPCPEGSPWLPTDKPLRLEDSRIPLGYEIAARFVGGEVFARGA